MEVAKALPCHGLRVRSEWTVQPQSPKRRGRFDVGGGVGDVSMAHGGLYICAERERERDTYIYIYIHIICDIYTYNMYTHSYRCMGMGSYMYITLLCKHRCAHIHVEYRYMGMEIYK